jgi:hypothetical protein
MKNSIIASLTSAIDKDENGFAATKIASKALLAAISFAD